MQTSSTTATRLDLPDPLPTFDRAIYMGDLTAERGINEIVALAQEMPELQIDLVGRISVDGESKDALVGTIEHHRAR